MITYILNMLLNNILKRLWWSKSRSIAVVYLFSLASVIALCFWYISRQSFDSGLHALITEKDINQSWYGISINYKFTLCCSVLKAFFLRRFRDLMDSMSQTDYLWIFTKQVIDSRPWKLWKDNRDMYLILNFWESSIYLLHCTGMRWATKRPIRTAKPVHKAWPTTPPTITPKALYRWKRKSEKKMLRTMCQWKHYY